MCGLPIHRPHCHQSKSLPPAGAVSYRQFGENRGTEAGVPESWAAGGLEPAGVKELSNILSLYLSEDDDRGAVEGADTTRDEISRGRVTANFAIMKWPEIYQEIVDQISAHEEFVNALQMFQFSSADEILDYERANRKTIDKACHEFAKSGDWPVLSKQQTILVYARLIQARQSMDSQGRQKGQAFADAETHTDKVHAICDLLIEYWEFAGLSRWRESIS